MSVLAWVAVAAVVAAAMVFGRTAELRAHEPGGRRALLVSTLGPLLVAVLGVVVGAVTGQWVPVAAGTVAVVLLTAVTGLLITP